MNKVAFTGVVLGKWKPMPKIHHANTKDDGFPLALSNCLVNYVFYTGASGRLNYIKIITKPEQTRGITGGDRVKCEGVMRSDFQDRNGNLLIHSYVHVKKIYPIDDSVQPQNLAKITGNYRPDVYDTQIRRAGTGLAASFVVECATNSGGEHLLIPVTAWGSLAHQVIQFKPRGPITVEGAITSRFYYKGERKNNIIEITATKVKEGNHNYGEKSQPKEIKARKLQGHHKA